jgi:beta-glucosidase
MLPPYKDPSLSEEERACDLLSRMTTAEKLAQMTMKGSIADIKRMADEGRLPDTGISCVYVSQPVSTDTLDSIQRGLIENTRLGIPMIVMGESLHGAMIEGATVFPQSIGMGATFNTSLAGEAAALIGGEVRAAGVRQTYAPNLDLSRDPRWGRVEENYGEDPYLTSRMGTAYIKGLQSRGVAASPKHYIAHGSPEGGINIAPVHIGLREFYENMYEPFCAAFREAGAMSVMPAYSEFDGIPVHASRFLLTDVLRHMMGFDGFTVSDFGALHMLVGTHHTAANALEAGMAALDAGLDLEAPEAFGFGGDFAKAVENGDVDMEKIDTAVLRILRIKIRLGLFENPYTESSVSFRSEAAVDCALRCARESVVLLENNGILPLDCGNIDRIALVGPNADSAQLGDYTVPGAVKRAVTLRAALESRLGKDRVIYERGCNISSGSADMIDRAVNAAKEAGICVAVLGDNSNYYGGIGWGNEADIASVTCGEGFDVSSLELPGAQKELLRAVRAAGVPVICILVTGRPYAIGEEASLSDALIEAWYPGESGGTALAEILFGDICPSGRLPISFPRSAGHLPCFYNYKSSARGFYRQPGSPEKPGRDYVFDTPSALYPFGFGLSYTVFTYGDISARVHGTDVTAAVEVKNTGPRAGAEAVLLFLRCHTSRITPFVRRLRGFEKVFLEPGESAEITFSLNADDFSFINEQYRPEIGYGKYTLIIGDKNIEIDIV